MIGVAPREKITFTADRGLKAAIKEIQETSGLKSISAVISEAVMSYKKQQKLAKWQKANTALATHPKWAQEEIELAEGGDNAYYEN